MESNEKHDKNEVKDATCIVHSLLQKWVAFVYVRVKKPRHEKMLIF